MGDTQNFYTPGAFNAYPVGNQ